MNLTKKDRKVARSIIEKGLLQEFANGLTQFDGILQQWKDQSMDTREAYQKMYSKVRTFDKHIAQRYDGMKGSNYLTIISLQLYDKVIAEDDIDELSEESQERVYQLVNFYRMP